MSSPANHIKILICEDDPGILEVVGIALDAAGFSHIGHDSLEGLEGRIETENPDLVLLDLHLGGASEKMTLERLKFLKERVHSHPRIVLMSAHAKLGEIAKEYNVDCLPKPFGLDELSAAIWRNL